MGGGGGGGGGVISMIAVGTQPVFLTRDLLSSGHMEGDHFKRKHIF